MCTAQEVLADMYLKDVVVEYDKGRLLSLLTGTGAFCGACVRPTRVAGLAALLLELGVVTSLHPLVF